MKTPAEIAASPRLPANDGPEKIELMRQIMRHESTAQKSAALLLLLGDQLCRLQKECGAWDDPQFGDFITCGIIDLTHEAAKALYTSTLP